MRQAACKNTDDPDMFFPEKGQSAKGNEAMIMCFGCPVRADCDDYRIRTNTKYGIWAATYTDRHG